MSYDEHGHEKEPMILTSGRRMGKGLLIMVITLAIGAAVVVPLFDDMYRNPPPVTQIRTPPPPSGPPQTGGPTVIAILSGAAVQGSPDYDPDNAQVPIQGVGSEIVWDNHDTVPHTATSGIGVDDPNKGKLFDTSIISPNDKSDNIKMVGVSEGDIVPYFCTVHPYMTSQLTIVAAGQGAQAGVSSGPTINILQGAAVQGSQDYDPDELTAKKGDVVSVINHDNVPHTVTSGIGVDDPNKGKLFDTSIINGGDSSKISLSEVDVGEHDYFCIIHPYMTGMLKVE